MVLVANLGFPRIGRRRRLKTALEAHWAGGLDAAGLEHEAREIRRARWDTQRHLGVAVVPVNDFSLYDHVLDAALMLGAIPERLRDGDPAQRYFRCARGDRAASPLALTKWYDTNYHYLVPELDARTPFAPDPAKPLAEWREARELGLDARPVLVGPLSFLRLAKRTDGGDALELIDPLIAAYAEVLRTLSAAGVGAVQIDEPALVTDLTPRDHAACRRAYAALHAAAPDLRLLLATYFGGLDGALPLAFSLPVQGVHLDLVRAPGQLDAALAAIRPDQALSLGLVDGRNVWRGDLAAAVALARRAVARIGGERVQVAPSCSLIHVPIDVDDEPALAPEVRARLAFATQKLGELALIAAAVNGGAALAPVARPPAPAAEAEPPAPSTTRASPYAVRCAAQARRLRLPPLPTTTIGSFPQTADLRARRAAWSAGRLDDAAYQRSLRDECAAAIRRQEEIGLDVLVHGEFERTDMVEHFAQRLDGFVVTAEAWVHSYGSRCVRPPIIVGRPARRAPMTVDWARYAQSLTAKPVKGMLTGPVTILQWSFAPPDQERSQVCRAIAAALRDEVLDLERAGIAIIQVDEPALREGLPLRRAGHAAYLAWAVECFRIATAGVRDETQIHTHLCYSEFSDILEAVVALDADVLSIECARSRMETVAALARAGYPNQIGPGVYDIHAPRVPGVDEVAALLRAACAALPAERLWVNPDCGLKTRTWEQVAPALASMVAAARAVRAGTG